MNNFWNLNPDDGFDPEDFENNEIAKAYAIADMKEDHKKWAYNQAIKFYSDFENLNIKDSVKRVNKLIKNRDVKKLDAIQMFDNLIKIFEEHEEYEKCHICNQIKKGIDNVRS